MHQFQKKPENSEEGTKIHQSNINRDVDRDSDESNIDESWEPLK